MSNTTNSSTQQNLMPLSLGHEPFYFVQSLLIKDAHKAIRSVLKEHLTFLKALNDKDKLLFAGPLQTIEGELTGDGIYTLKVNSLKEALEIVELDPLHKLGIRKPKVMVWQRKVNF